MFVTNDRYQGAALLAAVAAAVPVDLDTVVPVLSSSSTGGPVLHTSAVCRTEEPATLDLRTLRQLVDTLATAPDQLCTRCHNQFGDSLPELARTYSATRDWARWLQLAAATERVLQTPGSWSDLRRTESPWLSAVAVARLLVVEQSFADTHGWPGQTVAGAGAHPAHEQLRDQCRSAADRLTGLLTGLSWSQVPDAERAQAVEALLAQSGGTRQTAPETFGPADGRGPASQEPADWLVLVRQLHVDVSGGSTHIALPAPTRCPLAVASVLGAVHVPEFDGAGTYMHQRPAVLARVPAVMLEWVNATSAERLCPFLPVAQVPDVADDQLLALTQLALNAGATNKESAAAVLAAAPAALAPVA